MHFQSIESPHQIFTNWPERVKPTWMERHQSGWDSSLPTGLELRSATYLRQPMDSADGKDGRLRRLLAKSIGQTPRAMRGGSASVIVRAKGRFSLRYATAMSQKSPEEHVLSLSVPA